ncbi:MAG: phosphoribosylaminoimidazolesuccinocarboxamide synthase [Phycisphaerales bacterium]|nr:phosphoribosylaminoimidazolesuccinocarboxamide synthase [Phycisphaerales bacterium]
MSRPAELMHTDLPGLLHRGKVRDLYDLGDQLMIVATDRISAFDVVMNQPVPGKGVILTQMSRFWLELLPPCNPHHLDYVVQPGRAPIGYEAAVDSLAGRAMVVKKTHILPVECVARGFLIGGGWKEYQESGRVSGIELPAGLQQAQRLGEPIFTPSTKSNTGHDEPISFERAVEIAGEFTASLGMPASAGRDAMWEARRRTLDIYVQGARYAESRGIILADTKLEFGLHGGQLLLADEVLTPDSSRFWPADSYLVGTNPPSFDKQYLRDYLESIHWPKKPPPPPIPVDVLEQTRSRYVEAYRRLAG